MCDLHTHLCLIVKNDAKSISFCCNSTIKMICILSKLEYMKTDITDTESSNIKIVFCILLLSTLSTHIKVNNNKLTNIDPTHKKTTTMSKKKQGIKNEKKQGKICTSQTAISREPWQAVTGVVIYTVFTRSTVLTRVIDTFIDVFKEKYNDFNSPV